MEPHSPGRAWGSWSRPCRGHWGSWYWASLCSRAVWGNLEVSEMDKHLDLLQQQAASHNHLMGFDVVLLSVICISVEIEKSVDGHLLNSS